MAGDDAVLPCDKAILTVRMNQREEFERMNKNGHSATMLSFVKLFGTVFVSLFKCVLWFR